MNEKIVKNCMAFLERVQLQWNERDAATEVQNWLSGMINSPVFVPGEVMKPVETEAHKANGS